MNSDRGSAAKTQDVSDLLLYIGAIIVAGIGISWLVMTQPWSEDEPTDGRLPAGAVQAETAARNPRPLARPETVPDNPLRIARLAFEAGMLVEPERYSAWTLYAEILDADPENAAATTGLYEVADALVERATTAFEQGRFGDAEATVEHVLAELPAHDGAMQLSIAITEQQRSAAARERQQLADAAVEASPAALQAAVVAPAASDLRASAFPGVGAPAPTPLDPVLDLRAAFDDAIAADALVQPEEQNAKYFLNRMLDLDAEHARTVEAHELLFTTFLSRAATATVGLDEIAAETWIAEAEKLDADDARIGQARNDLLENLVMAESAKPVPAAQLTIVEYTSPRYPTAAANRNLEGWVDLEFVVTTDGRTEDVSVVDASHREYFRDEAVAAVEGWRFEPRTFHDRPIEQAAYTRIRFALE